MNSTLCYETMLHCKSAAGAFVDHLDYNFHLTASTVSLFSIEPNNPPIKHLVQDRKSYEPREQGYNKCHPHQYACVNKRRQTCRYFVYF